MQSLIAEHASAVGVGKRHHDHVTALDGAHVGASGLNHADRLVAYAAALFDRLKLVVRPEIAAAYAGARDADNRISRIHNSGIWDVLDTDVAGAVHHGCAHRYISCF